MIAVVAGAAAGVAGGVSLAVAAAGAVALAAAAILTPQGALRAATLVVAAALAAAADGGLARERALASPLGDWLDRHAPGARADEPVIVFGTLTDDAALVEEGARLVIDVERLGDGEVSYDVRGRIQVHVSGAMAAPAIARWVAGSRVRAPVMLRRADLLVNPGGPTEEWQLLRRQFDLLGTIKSAALVSMQPPVSPFDRIAAGVRRHVRDMAARDVAPHSQQSAAIVVAILIGDRVGLSDDVQRRLQAAGTYHVIAISGGNVALLAAFCLFSLRFIIRSARASAVLTIGVILAYGWIVGGGASVDRAVAGASLYLLVGLAGLIPASVNVLGLVAMTLALADPLTTIDVSAWLSFGASLAIILCAKRFEHWARDPKYTLSRSGRNAAKPQRLVPAVPVVPAVPAVPVVPVVPVVPATPRPLMVLFSATLSAELALAPVSAAVFSRVGIAGLVLNFAAIPAMSVVEIAGIVAAVFSGWWETGARIAGLVSSLAASFLVSSSSVVDTPSLVSWRVPPTWIGWTVIFYGVGAVFLWRRDRSRIRAACGIAALAALAIILSAPGLEMAAPPAGWLRVTLIDVGQGDSILVQFPTRQSLLVDAGGAAGFDIGGRVVTPALWASGVRHLDYLAFTHPDFDHIGGIRSEARDMSPREIWEGVPVPHNPARQAVWTDAQLQGLVWRQLSAGHVVTLGSVEVDVVNPPLPDWERQRTRNEDSLVLSLRFAGVEMLLTGDAGSEFESRPGSGDRHAPLRLLKVGHHGSRSSSTPAFVSAFDPQLVFVSVGRSNLFGHPSPEVVQRYEAIGATIFRTDRDGAIVIETDGRDVRVKTMRGRTWTVLMRRD